MRQIEKRFVSVYRGHRVSDQNMADLLKGSGAKIEIDISDAKSDDKVYRWIRGFETRALHLAVECVSKTFGKHVFQVEERVARGCPSRTADGRKCLVCNSIGEVVLS